MSLDGDWGNGDDFNVPALYSIYEMKFILKAENGGPYTKTFARLYYHSECILNEDPFFLDSNGVLLVTDNLYIDMDTVTRYCKVVQSHPLRYCVRFQTTSLIWEGPIVLTRSDKVEELGMQSIDIIIPDSLAQ